MLEGKPLRYGSHSILLRRSEKTTRSVYRCARPGAAPSFHLASGPELGRKLEYQGWRAPRTKTAVGGCGRRKALLQCVGFGVEKHLHRHTHPGSCKSVCGALKQIETYWERDAYITATHGRLPRGSGDRRVTLVTAVSRRLCGPAFTLAPVLCVRAVYFDLSCGVTVRAASF